MTPASVAMTKTQTGLSVPLRLKVMSSAARMTYTPRMEVSMTRPPTLSPSTPNIGAASVPRNIREPKAVSRSTEPVWTSTYQARMTVSISNARDVRRSAGHWKRKLRTRKAARISGKATD